MAAFLSLPPKQHPLTSIYLQINSTQIPKEASKKFHTFVTQRTKCPVGRGEGGSWFGIEGRVKEEGGGGGNKTGN